MSIAPFRDAVRFDVVLDRLASYEDDVWFYVPKGIGTVGPATICLPISDEDDFSWAETEGDLEEFLWIEDVRSIVCNLRQQRSAVDHDQIIQACNYYWLNDA